MSVEHTDDDFVAVNAANFKKITGKLEKVSVCLC